MVGSTILHYKILAEVGRGGMGVVYQAEDTRLGRTVALKFLAEHLAGDKPSRDRFMQEARATAALTHANIATLYDVIEERGQTFIAMEFVEGSSLKEVIDGGSLAPTLAVNYATQIAKGLRRAHEESVIHRDIKPANIVVNQRGDVKILDFGLARLGLGAGLSQTGTTLGTAAYMSPEQIRSDTVDHRADLWSLGVVFFEMLTGRRPFQEEYEHALYYSVLHSNPDPPSRARPDLGGQFDAIVDRLLQKDPSDRYAIADDVIADLDELAGVARPKVSAWVDPIVETPDATPTKSASASAISAVSEGERRPITVVYAELTGIEEIEEELEPEEVDEISEEYLQICTDEMKRYSAFAGPQTADAAVAYFGYPTAHEDDPVRGVRLAHSILRRADKLTQDRAARGEAGLNMRFGVHSGLAVVREDRGELRVLGRTGRLASMLVAKVAAGEVAASHDSQRISSAYFAFEPAGELEVRGASKPVPVYKATGETGAHTRVDATAAHDLTPLVGRDLELNILMQRWSQVRSGQGGVVLVSGEPGIGKSRLASAFRHEIASREKAWQIHLFASSAAENSSLHPFSEYLQAILNRAEGDDLTDFERLRTACESNGLSDQTAVALLADLAAVELPDGEDPIDLAPFAQKQRILQSLMVLMTSSVDEGPGIIMLEDLHWADPSTQEWVDLLISQLPSYPVLFLVTTRPPVRPDWLSKAHASEITLGRLAREDVVKMSKTRGGKALPPELVEAVAERTDGVPLFVEELTQMLLESGIIVDQGDRYELTGPLPEHEIPTTLQASLATRLDGMGSAKPVAQVGSVIGRRFPFGILPAVTAESEDVLERELAKLVDAEIVFQRGFVPDSTYVFKHAFIQDAAYSSLVKRNRQEVHRRVAEALQQQALRPSPELLAHHYTEGGLPRQALPLWMEAGQHAVGKNAMLEAVEHLKAAAGLVGSIEDAEARKTTELDILNLLAPAVMMARGYTDPEAEELFSKAQILCDEIDDPARSILSLQGLFQIYWIRAEYERAFQLAERSLEIAEEVDDTGFQLLGHNALGWTYFATAQLREARTHSERVIELYDPAQHDGLATLGVGHLNLNASESLMAQLHLQGHLDQAMALHASITAAAANTDNGQTLYNSHLWTGIVHLMRGEWDECVQVVSAYLPKLIEFGDPFKIGISSAIRNLGLRAEADEEEFNSARPVLDQLEALGFAAGMPILHGFEAEGQIAYGRYDRAESAVDRSIALFERFGPEYWTPDVFRLKGDIRHHLGDTAGSVEPFYQKALELAQVSGARSLELRAATSHARFSMSAGLENDSRSRLEAILSSFTEGLDTRDVIQARDALESL